MDVLRAGDLSPDFASSRKRPRIMVAGEFSSGKTRLVNGLVGRRVLPSNVTSTALPPVWLVGGSSGMVRVDVNGVAHDIASLEGIDVLDTHYCLIGVPDAPILKHFDIIDTPGNSDPNIPSISWERMLDSADMIVWCSTAVQAWRQSEKSVWMEMPQRLRDKATLLVTNADRLPDERSAQKVMRRVQRDAESFFDTFLLASLLNEADLRVIAEHLIGLCKQPEPVQSPVAHVTPDVPTQAPAAAEGPVRRLWLAMAAGKDLDNPEVMRETVDAFISVLDRSLQPKSAGQGSRRSPAPSQQPTVKNASA